MPLRRQSVTTLGGGGDVAHTTCSIETNTAYCLAAVVDIFGGCPGRIYVQTHRCTWGSGQHARRADANFWMHWWCRTTPLGCLAPHPDRQQRVSSSILGPSSPCSASVPTRNSWTASAHQTKLTGLTDAEDDAKACTSHRDGQKARQGPYSAVTVKRHL
jgi:hypothetical protein